MNSVIKTSIVLLGVFYLIIELAFNVTLLDTLGGKFDRELMENLEDLGKVISGVGLWIIILKLIDSLRLKFNISGMLSLLLAVVGLIFSITLMTYVQESVVNYVTDNSSGTERKTAYAIAISMNEIADGNTVVKGFDFSKEDFATSEGKTYLAILPAFAISQPNAEEIFTKAGIKSIYNIKNHEAEVQGQKAWNKYIKANQEIRDLYNKKYLPASKKYLNARSVVNPSVYWNQYIDTLDSKGVDMYNTPPSDRWIYPRVIQELKAKGLNMPAGWELHDKDTFYRVVRSKASSSESFQSAIFKHANIKTNLPPNLSWSQFANSDEVQTQIKQKGGLNIKENISLDMSRKAFFEKYVYPEMNKQSSKPEAMLLSESDDFKDGMQYEEEGRNAVKRVEIPMVALALSCLFALLNLSFVVSSLFGKKLAPFVAIFIIGIWTTLPFFMTNKITSSETFDVSVNRTHNYIRYPVQWLANIQPTIHENFKDIVSFINLKSIK